MTSQGSSLQGDFASALRGGQFELVYQPIVSFSGLRMAGVEGLLRWNHPRLGVLLPASFIPLAEETGFIRPLGRWVREHACDQLRKWQLQDPSLALTLNVNVSPHELEDPAFVDQVGDVVERSGISSATLCLEITETLILTDAHLARAQELHQLNVSLAMDNFGIGYSSLSTVSTLPLKSVKIASSWVQQLDSSPDVSQIIRSIVHIDKSRQIQTVAVGAENDRQVTLLGDMGCDAVQGYRFSRPVADHEVSRLLSRSAPLWRN